MGCGNSKDKEEPIPLTPQQIAQLNTPYKMDPMPSFSVLPVIGVGALIATRSGDGGGGGFNM